MVTFNFKNKKYKCKNKLNELTLQEFQDISKIYEDGSTQGYEKGLKVLELIGVPYSVIEELPAISVSKAIKALLFNTDFSKIKGNKKIEIEGYTYQLMDLKELTTKQFKKLKNLYKKSDRIKLISAFIFIREDLTDTEHYDDVHIKHKADLFSDLSVKYFIPNILLIQHQMNENLKILIDENGAKTEN